MYIVCRCCQYKDQSMQCIECCMLCCLSTLSIQRSKYPMHWIVYAMLFVDTVNMKIKACNAFNAICRSSWYKTHSHISAHNFLNIHCRYKTRISNAFNAMYVDTVDTKHIYTHLYISPYNFLNIQPIFNPQKVLESWDWGLFNHTIKYYMSHFAYVCKTKGQNGISC